MRVRIEGPVTAGKSTLAYALQRMLEKHGVRCVVEDDNIPSKMTDERINKGLDAMTHKGGVITIKTFQLPTLPDRKALRGHLKERGHDETTQEARPSSV